MSGRYDTEGCRLNRLEWSFPWKIVPGSAPDGVTLANNQAAFAVRRGYIAVGETLDATKDIKPSNDSESEQPLHAVVTVPVQGNIVHHVWAEVLLQLGGDFGVLPVSALLKDGPTPADAGWPWFPSQGNWPSTLKGFLYIGYITAAYSATLSQERGEDVYVFTPRNVVRQHLRVVAPYWHLCHEIAPVDRHLAWTGQDVRRRTLLFLDANSNLLGLDSYLYA
ncbi:MAG: hypothetical protein NT105_23665 [Verrucomicrobia bacterium]|nr:hypothetical protein [Verrucomicrobiota bacterium]